MTAVTGPDQGRAALLSAFACYTLWGFMPLLFMGQAAVGFDSLEILAHRALWAVAVAGLLVWLAKQGGQVRAVLTSPKTLAWLVFSTALIGLNWGVYVWATTHGATLEASLGYYINPLHNRVVGLWLFREKIDRRLPHEQQGHDAPQGVAGEGGQQGGAGAVRRDRSHPLVLSHRHPGMSGGSMAGRRMGRRLA